MNRPILRAGLILGAFSFGLCGCHQASLKSDSVKAEKPTDPTAWNDKSLPKDDSNVGTSNGLAKSSRLTGGWSSESRDIEKSLGVSN